MFSLQDCSKSDVLLLLLFNCALEFRMMRVRGSQQGLKLNDTSASTLNWRWLFIERKRSLCKDEHKNFPIRSYGSPSTVTADRSKYLCVCVLSTESRTKLHIKLGNKLFENVTNFTKFGTRLTINCIREKIEFGKCLLPSSSKPFFFPSDIQKRKDKNMHNCSVASSFGGGGVVGFLKSGEHFTLWNFSS